MFKCLVACFIRTKKSTKGKMAEVNDKQHFSCVFEGQDGDEYFLVRRCFNVTASHESVETEVLEDEESAAAPTNDSEDVDEITSLAQLSDIYDPSSFQNRLPTELWTQILSHLTPLELVKATEVNTFYRDLACHVLSFKHLDLGTDWRIFKNISLESLSRLKSSSFRFASSSADNFALTTKSEMRLQMWKLSKALPYMHNLNSLELSFDDQLIFYGLFISGIEKCKELKELSLKFSDYNLGVGDVDYIVSLPKLQRFSWFGPITEIPLLAIFNMERLVHLELDNCQNIIAKHFHNVKHLVNLKSLFLRGMNPTALSFHQKLPKSSKMPQNLTRLGIGVRQGHSKEHHEQAQTEQNLNAIVRKFNNVEELHLTIPSKIDVAFVPMPRLKTLNLQRFIEPGFLFISPNPFLHLLPKLRNLSIQVFDLAPHLKDAKMDATEPYEVTLPRYGPILENLDCISLFSSLSPSEHHPVYHPLLLKYVKKVKRIDMRGIAPLGGTGIQARFSNFFAKTDPEALAFSGLSKYTHRVILMNPWPRLTKLYIGNGVFDSVTMMVLNERCPQLTHLRLVKIAFDWSLECLDCLQDMTRLRELELVLHDTSEMAESEALVEGLMSPAFIACSSAFPLDDGAVAAEDVDYFEAFPDAETFKVTYVSLGAFTYQTYCIRRTCLRDVRRYYAVQHKHPHHVRLASGGRVRLNPEWIRKNEIPPFDDELEYLPSIMSSVDDWFR